MMLPSPLTPAFTSRATSSAQQGGARAADHHIEPRRPAGHPDHPGPREPDGEASAVEVGDDDVSAPRSVSLAEGRVTTTYIGLLAARLPGVVPITPAAARAGS